MRCLRMHACDEPLLNSKWPRSLPGPSNLFHMKKFLTAALPVFLLLSCGSENDTLPLPSGNYIFDTITSVYKADFTESWASGQDFITIGGSTWMPYSFCTSGRLLFKCIDSDSLLSFPFPNPSCGKIHASGGSNGFLVMNDNGDLFLCDRKSETPQHIINVLKDIPAMAASGMIPEYYKPGGDQRCNVPENVFYFRVAQNHDDLSGKYAKYDIGYPITAKLDIGTREIRFFGKMPAFSAHNEFGLLSGIFDLYQGDSIIYSSAVDGRLTVINTQSGKESVIDRQSSYGKNAPKRIAVSRFSQTQEARTAKWQHELLSPSYEPLFFNPADGHYYRLFHPEMNELNDDGLMNTESDKSTILMVFDRKLNLVEEIVLPVNGHRFVKIFPLKDGTGLSLKNISQNGGYASFPMLRVRKKQSAK
jgi:hypothetical protein